MTTKLSCAIWGVIYASSTVSSGLHSERWTLGYFSIFWNNNLILDFLSEHMGSLNYVMQLP